MNINTSASESGRRVLVECSICRYASGACAACMRKTTGRMGGIHPCTYLLGSNYNSVLHTYNAAPCNIPYFIIISHFQVGAPF